MKPLLFRVNTVNRLQFPINGACQIIFLNNSLKYFLIIGYGEWITQASGRRRKSCYSHMAYFYHTQDWKSSVKKEIASWSENCDLEVVS